MKFTFEEIAKAVSGTVSGSFHPSDTVTDIFTDTRKVCPDSLFIALAGETFDAHEFLQKAVDQGAKLLLVEKSKLDKVPAGFPAVAVDSTVRAWQNLAAYHRSRFPSLKLAALTGSCGKTSTKETLRAIFEYEYGKEHVLATEGNTNNQLGVPQNLLRLTPDHQAAVIEMGTNHHGEIAPLAQCAMPSGAMIVSIGACHLEFLGSLEGVAKEKSNVFSTLPPGAPGVIPCKCAGNDILRAALAGHPVLTFGPEEEADFRVEYLGGTLSGASFRLTCRATGESDVVNWKIPGRHQANNAAGAAALAYALGVPFAHIVKGIVNTTLPGLRVRVTEHDGATWINDAYNANPDSMKASIEWLHEFADPAQLFLVLGDMGEIGSGSEEAHYNTLVLARQTFPSAKIAAVGAKMTAAAQKMKENGLIPPDMTFPDSAAAVEPVRAACHAGNMVFLKASRSTRMEKIEPGFDPDGGH